MGKLDGKVALVTGSGRNIGRATVLQLAAEGANVVVNSRSNQAEADAVAQEARGLGVKALSVLADVANKEQVDSMMSRAMAETVSYVNRARAFMPTGTVPPFVMRFDAGSVPVGELVFTDETGKLGLKDLQEAVDAPRFHHQWLPDTLVAEKFALPRDVTERLEAKGHHLREADGPIGALEAIWFDIPGGWIYGVSDPREGGDAEGD